MRTNGAFRALILFLAALLTACGAASAEPEAFFDYTVLEDGSACITEYRGSEAELAFPETTDGKTVSCLSGTFETRPNATKTSEAL